MCVPRIRRAREAAACRIGAAPMPPRRDGGSRANRPEVPRHIPSRADLISESHIRARVAYRCQRRTSAHRKLETRAAHPHVSVRVAHQCTGNLKSESHIRARVAYQRTPNCPRRESTRCPSRSPGPCAGAAPRPTRRLWAAEETRRPEVARQRRQRRRDFQSIAKRF